MPGIAKARRRDKDGGMRTLLVAVMAVAASLAMLPSATAADWGHYVNERFGVEADVPPDFVAGEPPANGDGLGFSTPTAKLGIFGSLVSEGDFESNVRDRIGWSEADGWAITYRAVTPNWASWSGTRGSRILYVRAISMCAGDMIGAFEFEYSQADRAAFDPVVERLVGSLKDNGTGWQC
jgi:hypothetical protein